MLRTSELNMAESVKASDIDIFLSDAAWAICSTNHTVLKASPGAAIFGRDMLFDIPFIGPFCQGIFVVRFVVQFILPQIVPQIVQKPPQKRGTISEVFDTILWYDLRTPPPIGMDYQENIQFQEMDI
jgi:hypothetical protein